MKRLLFCAYFGLLSLPVMAQIEFQHLTLDEAKALAKKENKPIFVDVHAVWCGPCKYMAANAFTDKGLGEYYNANFINVKIDGEKEAEGGPKTMREYGITAYPTLLYINPDGTLNQKVIGGQDVAQLRKHAKKVVDPSGKAVQEARTTYYKSKRTVGDLQKYLGVLSSEGADSLDIYSKVYYDSKSKLDLSQPEDFYAFSKFEMNSDSETSKYFLEHIEEFNAKEASAKIMEWIRADFQIAIAKRDISIIENTVKKVHAAWDKVEDVPTLEEYLIYVREQYNNYLAQ